jgi:PucR C-terminal helix-turn-helix domain
MRSRRFAATRHPEPGASVIDSLRREQNRLADEIVRAVRHEVPGLAAVPDEQLRQAVNADLRAAVDAIAEGRPSNDDELAASAAVAATCARARIPIETVLRSRRVGVRHLCDAVRDLELDPDPTFECIYGLWEWADAVQLSDVEAHRMAELEMNDSGADARVWFVRALLAGALSQAEVAARAAAYGLLPGVEYFAFRGRPAAGVDARALARAIRSSGGDNGLGVLIAAVDGDVCGASSRVPAVDGEGTVGVGGEADLTRMGESFRLATRALETALAFGYSGVVTLDDVSVRSAVLSEAYVGERLVSRYLDPLSELGEFGAALEETIRAYIDHDLRIDESAEALYVHPNTLRQRLRRIMELTGIDLRRDDWLMVEIAVKMVKLEQALGGDVGAP